MAGIEDLSPAELRAFRLGKLLESNPEVRREALRLARKADPKLRIPELELEDRVDAERDARLKSEEKLEHQLMEERVARRKSERDAQIVAAGFTVDEIEKIIVDEKCSYETAMKLAELMKSTAEPSAGEVRTGAPGEPIELRPGEDFRKLGTNVGGLRRLSASIAGQMIDQFRGRRRAAS